MFIDVQVLTVLFAVEQVLAQIAAEHALLDDAAALKLRTRRTRLEEAAQEADQFAALAQYRLRRRRFRYFRLHRLWYFVADQLHAVAREESNL